MAIALLLEIQTLYENKLFKCKTNEGVLALCLHAVFHIISFVGGFRGEEMPMLSLDGVAKYLTFKQPSDPDLAHVMIALRGRVKGERKAEACHLIPIVDVLLSRAYDQSYGWRELWKHTHAWEPPTDGCSGMLGEHRAGRGITNRCCSR
jgi:hypothetical protein